MADLGSWFDRNARTVTVVTALLVPLAGLLGASLTQSEELRVRQLELAVDILAVPLEDADDAQRGLRAYGVDLLELTSPVEIDAQLREQLIDGDVGLQLSTLTLPLTPTASVTEAPELPRDCRLEVSGDAVADLDGGAVEPGEYEVSRIERQPRTIRLPSTTVVPSPRPLTITTTTVTLADGRLVRPVVDAATLVGCTPPGAG